MEIPSGKRGPGSLALLGLRQPTALASKGTSVRGTLGVRAHTTHHCQPLVTHLMVANMDVVAQMGDVVKALGLALGQLNTATM